MEKNKEFERNRPADEGRNHDPHIRDASAAQPGMNTTSSSDTDAANERITKTTADQDRKSSPGDEKADKVFDE